MHDDIDDVEKLRKLASAHRAKAAAYERQASSLEGRDDA